MFTSRFDLCQSSNFGQQPMNCVSQPDVVCRVPPHRKHRSGQPVSRARKSPWIDPEWTGKAHIAGVGPITRAVFCPSDTWAARVTNDCCSRHVWASIARCQAQSTASGDFAALRTGEGPWRPLAYLFLVADCALRSACSAHAIHAAAISINIALSFSDARCAKRRHSAAYSRNRTASFSMHIQCAVPMFPVANREL